MRLKTLKIDLDNKNLVDISFDINSSLALIGQSGSGKSLTLKALLGMLPNSMKLQLEVDSDFELIAGETISLVPQNPFTALSPLTKIKKQFFSDISNIETIFSDVELDLDILQRFPPELSGGQLQRIIIAMALEHNPKLILLDEPTTALDPHTKIVILNLLKRLQKTKDFKMLFVTHDISSAKDLCDEIVVIKDGKMVEKGKMADILQNPTQLYTKTLIEANFANRKFRE